MLGCFENLSGCYWYRIRLRGVVNREKTALYTHCCRHQSPSFLFCLGVYFIFLFFPHPHPICHVSLLILTSQFLFFFHLITEPHPCLGSDFPDLGPGNLNPSLQPFSPPQQVHWPHLPLHLMPCRSLFWLSPNSESSSLSA